MKTCSLSCSLIGTVLLFLCGGRADSATFSIANGDVAGLKSAINTANTNDEFDSIYLALGGIYTLTTTDNSTEGENGLPVILDDVSPAGTDLIIYGNGATIQRSTAASTPLFRILLIASGTTCAIENLTITGGKLIVYHAEQGGGGIRSKAAQLTLIGCIFEGHTVLGVNGFTLPSGYGQNGAAALGGALLSGDNTTATNCVFTGNSASGGFGGQGSGDHAGGDGGDAEGGAIESFGNIIITNCTFNNNSAASGGRGTPFSSFPLNFSGRGFGGAVTAYGPATVTGCTFKANNATSNGNDGFGQGGGLMSSDASTVTNSTFRSNTAKNSAGGFALNSGGTISSCTFANNSAETGGGIVSSATVSITNCTLSNNTARFGGGIFHGDDLTVIGCTLSNNSAFRGGGIYNAGGTLRLANTIFKSGAAGGNLYNNEGSITSQGFNLSNDDGSGFLVAAGDQINTEPNLGSLGPNGGATDTYPLLPGSPALDKGKRFTAPPATDQRGHNRPDDDPAITNAAGGDGSDIGAYEAGGGPVQSGTSLVVNSVNDHLDPGANPCTTGDCSLREALLTANSQAGDDTIHFAAGASGTISLTSPLPTLSTNLGILGPGANILTVRRDTGGNYRILTISNGTSSGPTVTITGLTIANGLAEGNFPASAGGGIYNDHGTLTLRNCALSGNRATSEAGGIFNEGFGAGAPLIVEGCTFSNNTAGNSGGGLFNSVAVVTMSNCTFNGNNTGVGGGGIAQSAGFSGSAMLTMINCTLSGNTASNGAGGISNGIGGSLRLANSILARNTGGNFSSNATITSWGHNLSDDAAGGGTGTGPGGFLNGPGDMRNTNPQLDSLGLQNNGGPTETVALLSGSPALDTGDDTFAPATDQRGYLRVGVSDIGAFEFGSQPLALIGALSRKTHGSAGTFDIPLPLTGAPGVECRSSGGAHALVFAFSNNIVSGNASLTSGTGGVAGSPTFTNNTMTVNLTGVTDLQKITVTLSGVTDSFAQVLPNTAVSMNLLIGDTSGNKTVNSTDISQTKLQSGQAVTATNFRQDVTVSGTINASDIGLVKLRSGQSVP